MPKNDKYIETLYTTHFSELKAVLVSKYGIEPTDSEDVLQIAFSKFSRHEKNRSIENPAAYIFRIAKNIIIDKARRDTAFKNILKSSIDDSLNNDQTLCNPERILDGQQRLIVIQNVYSSMPERRREIIRMSRFEGLKNVEIGARLGISETAVRKHITTALLEIRRAVLNETVEW